MTLPTNYGANKTVQHNVHVNDADEGMNSVVNFTFDTQENEDWKYFRIDRDTGVISTTQVINVSK